MKWYYAINNQRQGPVSENEFDFLVHQKKITPDTLVWNETMPAWRPLRDVRPEAPPPVPPAFDWSSRAAVEPTQPAPPRRDGPPWEERDTIGGLKAAGWTVLDLLRSPTFTFSRMKRESDWAGPYCFALFFWGISTFANLAYLIIVSRSMQDNLKMPWLIFTSNYFTGFMAAFIYFFLPVCVAVIVLLNSALIHFCLSIVGGSRMNFQATYRVVCYSLGASAALQVIPQIGPLLGAVFNLVLLVRGIAGVHEVSPLKAFLAVIPVVICACLFVLIGLGMA